MGILAAMEEEVSLLKPKFHKKTHGKNVFPRVFKTGVGKTNGAIKASWAIHEGGSDQIFSVGTCAGIHPDIQPGEIILVTDAMFHDFDVTALGFKRGQIPFETASSWKVDRALLDLAKAAAEKLKLKTHVGRILSGDRFVADEAEAKSLSQQFGGIALDMETAAIAHACAVNAIPWLGIRVVTDKAGDRASVDFSANLNRVMPQIVTLLVEMFRDLQVTNDFHKKPAEKGTDHAHRMLQTGRSNRRQVPRG